MSRKKKAIPERLLPIVMDGAKCKTQFLDVTIRNVFFGSRKIYSVACNPEIDVVEVACTRLFRVDDQFNEDNEVILADDDFFYFSYEIEIRPSEGTLYSQLLTAAFYGEEMPASEFNISMLEDKWVRLVIEDGRFLSEIRPLADTSAIDKSEVHHEC